jgi:hypothetical protein
LNFIPYYFGTILVSFYSVKLAIFQQNAHPIWLVVVSGGNDML